MFNSKKEYQILEKFGFQSKKRKRIKERSNVIMLNFVKSINPKTTSIAAKLIAYFFK